MFGCRIRIYLGANEWNGGSDEIFQQLQGSGRLDLSLDALILNDAIKISKESRFKREKKIPFGGMNPHG